MSYNVAHINVIDKNGNWNQIFQIKGIFRLHLSLKEIEQAKKTVEDCYPNYRKAKLIIMHYNKNDYNDKSNVIEL